MDHGETSLQRDFLSPGVAAIDFALPSAGCVDALGEEDSEKLVEKQRETTTSSYLAEDRVGGPGDPG